MAGSVLPLQQIILLTCDPLPPHEIACYLLVGHSAGVRTQLCRRHPCIFTILSFCCQSVLLIIQKIVADSNLLI